MSLPEHLQVQIAAETQFYRVPGDFALENGEVLREVARRMAPRLGWTLESGR